MIYDLIAPIYDEINAEIDYSSWADFIECLFDKNAGCRRPELVLDLCCGSGKMTRELAKRGYDMTGVDYSSEMLGVARDAAEKEGLDSILWLEQDVRELELYGTVGACVCCLDSINHLTSSRDLDVCLSLVHNYLDPDGLFIFDLNGRRKFEEVYGQATYAMDLGDRFCIWQNDYDPKTRICDFYITLFSELNDGSYERYDEVQREKMYTLRSMRRHLTGAGFEVVGAYSDFQFNDADDSSDRIYLVARCKKVEVNNGKY